MVTALTQPDDPFRCEAYAAGGSVWFHYTATQDGLLRATTAGSDPGTILAANTGQRGQVQGVADGCEAGTTCSSPVSIDLAER